MKLEDPATWPAPAQAVTGTHERYGGVVVTAWASTTRSCSAAPAGSTTPDRYRSSRAA